MPQATEELRKRWNGPSDYTALEYLKARGYVLTERFTWRKLGFPASVATENDQSAVLFLMQEWDYGGIDD